jgi:hypothetical protein
MSIGSAEKLLERSEFFSARWAPSTPPIQISVIETFTNSHSRSFQRKKLLHTFVFQQKYVAVRAQRCETLLTLFLILQESFKNSPL